MIIEIMKRITIRHLVSWKAYKNRRRLHMLDYREIQTEKEAKEFPREKYKDSCDQYKRKNKIMLNYKYRISQMEDFMGKYLGNVFWTINNYLRSDGEYNEKLNMVVDRLNELIMCAPRLDENIVVYRGVSQSTMKMILNKVQENDGNYTEKAFMSTSLRFDTVVREFQPYDCILKIYVPKGAFVLGIDCIDDRNEEEMLFPNNQWLKYIGKERKKRKAKSIYEFKLVNCYHEWKLRLK